MRLHRFFSETLLAEKKVLLIEDKNLLNQWRRVLRLQSGDKIILFDGSGFDFLFSIQKITNKKAEIGFIEKQKIDLELPTDLHLIQSIIKRDKFELILEKTTELGIQKIVPVISKRSVKLKLNLDRSKKIIKEAAEQSGKTSLPKIPEPIKLQNFFDRSLEEGRTYLTLDPTGEKFSSEDFNKKKLGIFVGPEGGFSEEEIKMFKENNVPIVSLGKQILRAETAAIVSVAITQFGKNS